MPTKTPPVRASDAGKPRRSYATHPHLAKQAVRSRRHWTRHMLLHPTAVFCLLVVGVLLSGLTIRVIADELLVSATVPADPLTSGAIITSPSDGATFSVKPISVSGTCPDESYVKLFRNGIFSGVAACDNQTFAIETDLFVGRNTLQTQAYNVTDQAGPVTATIDVTYSPPVTPPGGTISPVAPPATGKYVPPSSRTTVRTPAAIASNPLLLWTDYTFNVVTTNKQFSWKLAYQFGTPPYTTRIDWGDGRTSHLTVSDENEFTISHRYDLPGYYKIAISGSDSAGHSSLLQLIALVKVPGAPGTIGSIISGGSSDNGGGLKLNWLMLAWPTYGVVMLMTLSFWLGERREYLHMVMKSKHRLKHQT